MKKIILILIIPAIFLTTCKKKDEFVESNTILQQWTNAIEKLNYRTYARFEAYPKSEPVFREIYRDFYFADLMVVNVEDPDQERKFKDGSGNSFIKRNVMFECAEVNRKTKKYMVVVRGDVDFIKFIEGPRENEGWLMWNRNLIRVNQQAGEEK